MNAKRITMVNVDKIVPAPFNPVNRTTANNIRELKESIQEVGIIYPLLITDKFDLVDGHRRLACAKALNMKAVPALFVNGDSAEWFDHVNRTVSKISKKDWLFIYLAGGPVSKSAKQVINAVSKYLDRKDLEYAAENRISVSGIQFAMNITLRYIQKANKTTDLEFEKKLAKYLIYNSQSFALRMAIARKMGADHIIEAVENNTDIPIW